MVQYRWWKQRALGKQPSQQSRGRVLPVLAIVYILRGDSRTPSFMYGNGRLHDINSGNEKIAFTRQLYPCCWWRNGESSHNAMHANIYTDI